MERPVAQLYFRLLCILRLLRGVNGSFVSSLRVLLCFMVLFSLQVQCFFMTYERALESNEEEVLAILALRVFNLDYAGKVTWWRMQFLRFPHP